MLDWEGLTQQPEKAEGNLDTDTQTYLATYRYIYAPHRHRERKRQRQTDRQKSRQTENKSHILNPVFCEPASLDECPPACVLRRQRPPGHTLYFRVRAASAYYIA